MYRGEIIIAVASIAVASPAYALNQSKHYDVTVESCRAAGLPSAFCNAAGAVDYDVDADEWSDLAAHAQIPDGGDACDAANNSAWRVFWLGQQIRGALIAVGTGGSQRDVDALASDVGRALHTLQDDCAHKGMPNPQHAWHSLKDSCQSTTESPDVQPDAYVCAREETDALFAALTDVLHDTGGDFSSLTKASTVGKEWPGYGDVCAFLGSAGSWDGGDRRWELSIVRSGLRAQLLAALGGADESQFARVCGSAGEIAPRMSDARLDTSGGAQSCLKVHVFCLGKADENAAPAPPPWATEETAATTMPSVATDATVHGGCAFGGHAPPPAAPSLAALALAALLARRRRRA